MANWSLHGCLRQAPPLGGFAPNRIRAIVLAERLLQRADLEPATALLKKWCAMQGSNLRLLACEASALPLS